jgi:hypothetical protein
MHQRDALHVKKLLAYLAICTLVLHRIISLKHFVIARILKIFSLRCLHPHLRIAMMWAIWQSCTVRECSRPKKLPHLQRHVALTSTRSSVATVTLFGSKIHAWYLVTCMRSPEFGLLRGLSSAKFVCIIARCMERSLGCPKNIPWEK